MPTPTFNLGFAFEGRGFVGKRFLIDYFDRFMATGVGTTLAVLMVLKTLGNIGGNAGIKRSVLTEEKINKIHKVSITNR